MHASVPLLGRHNLWPIDRIGMLTRETEFGVEQIAPGRVLGQIDGGQPDRVAVKQNWMQAKKNSPCSPSL